MFTFTRPPQNSIDAAATWIHPDDPAWDKDRIDAEIKEMTELDQPIEEDEHPVRRWGHGKTAFDIDASMSHPLLEERVTARDYLDSTQVVFTIKPFDTLVQAMDYDRAYGDKLAKLAREAVAYGLVKIEAQGKSPTLHRDSAGRLDERSMLMLYHSDQTALLIHHLGGAIARLGIGTDTKKH